MWDLIQSMLGYFFAGFGAALGFMVGLILMIIIVIRAIKRMGSDDVATLRQKLNLEMMADYLNKLNNQEAYEEAAGFQKFIEEFRTLKVFDAQQNFWDTYEIMKKSSMKMRNEDVSEDNNPDGENVHLGPMELRISYVIERREE